MTYISTKSSENDLGFKIFIGNIRATLQIELRIVHPEENWPNVLRSKLEMFEKANTQMSALDMKFVAKVSGTPGIFLQVRLSQSFQKSPPFSTFLSQKQRGVIECYDFLLKLCFFGTPNNYKTSVNIFLRQGSCTFLWNLFSPICALLYFILLFDHFERLCVSSKFFLVPFLTQMRYIWCLIASFNMISCISEKKKARRNAEALKMV